MKHKIRILSAEMQCPLIVTHAAGFFNRRQAYFPKAGLTNTVSANGKPMELVDSRLSKNC
jgi:hypothetical protein